MSDCFIIMPITTPKHLVYTYGGDHDHFQHVLDHLFIPAINGAGLNPIPPAATGSDIIQANIIKNLEGTDLVLCDMSTLNPNVFFELGIRTAVDKPVCMVKDNATKKVPFDTSIINYHTYDNSLTPWTLDQEIKALADHLKTVVGSGERNSLWRYFGLSSKAEFSKEDTGADAKMDLLLMKVEGLKRQLISQQEGVDIKPQKQTIASNIKDYIRVAFATHGLKDPVKILIDNYHDSVAVICQKLPLPGSLDDMIILYAKERGFDVGFLLMPDRLDI